MNERIWLTGILCVAFGMGMGGIHDWRRDTKDDTSQVFREENRPSVMRTSEMYRKDLIYVEDSENPDNYVSLARYLEGFDKHDADIEKARIKKQVGY